MVNGLFESKAMFEMYCI